jgi:hypothetical protein
MAHLWDHKFYDYTDEQLEFARKDIASTLQAFQWDTGHNKYISDKLEERDTLLAIIADRKEQREVEAIIEATEKFAYAVKVAEAHTPSPEHFQWEDGKPVFVDSFKRRWVLTAKLSY